VGSTQLSTTSEIAARLAPGRLPTGRGRRAHAAPPRAGPSRSWNRFGVRTAAWSVLAWIGLGLLLGVAGAVTGGDLVRVQAMTVLSGSMRPSLGVGDLIISQVIRVDQLRAGDITTYQDTEADRFITHRVQSISWRGDLADVVTRGDANEVAEYWTAPASGKVGRVMLHVPRLGYLVGSLSTTAGHLGVVAAAVLLGGWALLVIWLPRADPADDDA
jgi:signal peptidase